MVERSRSIHSSCYFQRTGKGQFQLVQKICTKFRKGARSAAKAPFSPPPGTSDDRTPFFLSAFFPGRSRTQCQLRVCDLVARGKTNSDWRLTLQMRYDATRRSTSPITATSGTLTADALAAHEGDARDGDGADGP